MTALQRLASTLASLTHRFPWWLAALVGAAAIALGVVLVLQPFTSLGALVVVLALALVVSGVGRFAGDDATQRASDKPAAEPGTVNAEADTYPASAEPPAKRDLLFAAARIAIGLASVAAGVVVLVLPAITIVAITIVVAIVLIIGGLIRCAGVLRGPWDDRLVAVLFGATSVILGVVALSWPDVTVFIIAAVFGVQVALFGIDQSVKAMRRMLTARGSRTARDEAVAASTAAAAASAEATPPQSRPTLRRSLRAAGAVVAIAAAIAVLAVSARLSTAPRPDEFYSPPAEVSAEPGQLLRSEPFTTGIPAGATAWRILYTTTRDEGVPALASGLVVVPDDDATDRPVIAWAHGTTGVAEGCAPTLLDPFVAGAMPDASAALAQGWAIVATDYIGLGTEGPHPYLIGQPTARSVLDAIRAAQQLDAASLGTRTAVWGHSQGGHAALWTGGLAPSYAPELDIVGVAALSPAANLPALLGDIAGTTFGNVFGSFVAVAYDEAYPDVSLADYVRPAARIGLDEMSRRCLSNPATLVSVVTSIVGGAVWQGDPARGALLDRAAQNVPTLPIESPLLLAQGEADDLVTPASQNAYVTDRCAAGQAIDYRTYAGYGHLDIVAADSPPVHDLLEWTQQRFAGDAPADTCASRA